VKDICLKMHTDASCTIKKTRDSASAWWRHPGTSRALISNIKNTAGGTTVRNHASLTLSGPLGEKLPVCGYESSIFYFFWAADNCASSDVMPHGGTSILQPSVWWVNTSIFGRE
jgi:hypothetical protein